MIELNPTAFVRLGRKKRLEVVPWAKHLLVEPGSLDVVVRLARAWFPDPSDERRDAMSFRDRTEAGLRLAEALRPLASKRPVIVALPRGVPVAFEIARELRAPLEVLIVRKIGAPGHSELGLGTLVDGTPPQVVLNPSMMDMVRPSQAHVDAETQRQTEELERRRRLYIGDRTPLETTGRIVRGVISTEN